MAITATSFDAHWSLALTTSSTSSSTSETSPQFGRFGSTVGESRARALPFLSSERIYSLVVGIIVICVGSVLLARHVGRLRLMHFLRKASGRYQRTTPAHSSVPSVSFAEFPDLEQGFISRRHGPPDNLDLEEMVLDSRVPSFQFNC